MTNIMEFNVYWLFKEKDLFIVIVFVKGLIYREFILSI